MGHGTWDIAWDMGHCMGRGTFQRNAMFQVSCLLTYVKYIGNTWDMGHGILMGLILGHCISGTVSGDKMF